jgi:hypothetical protein
MIIALSFIYEAPAPYLYLIFTSGTKFIENSNVNRSEWVLIWNSKVIII